MGNDGSRESLDTVAHASAFSRVLCLVGHADAELALEALTAGASGCISKDAGMTEVHKTIVAAGRGELLLPCEVQDALVQRMRRQTPPSAPALTAREAQVLDLAAAGLTSTEIAERLSISVGTVKTHLHHVYDKLAVEGRAAAIAEGLRHRLLR